MGSGSASRRAMPAHLLGVLWFLGIVALILVAFATQVPAACRDTSDGSSASPGVSATSTASLVPASRATTSDAASDVAVGRIPGLNLAPAPAATLNVAYTSGTAPNVAARPRLGPN